MLSHIQILFALTPTLKTCEPLLLLVLLLLLLLLLCLRFLR